MLAQDALLGDRYRLTSRIAIGGMGEVWRAEDMVLNRTVAVKVLKSELTSDPTFLARFRAEARTTAALSHPGIANVFDYGEAVLGGPGGLRTAYLVMEHVVGEPLSAILAREGRLAPPRTLDIVRQAATALDVAHRTGIAHRDVKPGNLLVRPDGVVKVTDFGIARVADSVPLTQNGMVVGTAQYFSPEQAEGRAVTAASDVYSLGVVAYECLAGRLPFVADTAVAVAVMQIRDTPPPLPNDVLPTVRELVARAMAKDPRHRYGTGGELAAAVRAVQERPYDDPNTVVPVPLGATLPGPPPPPSTGPPSTGPPPTGLAGAGMAGAPGGVGGQVPPGATPRRPGPIGPPGAMGQGNAGPSGAMGQGSAVGPSGAMGHGGGIGPGGPGPGGPPSAISSGGPGSSATLGGPGGPGLPGGASGPGGPGGPGGPPAGAPPGTGTGIPPPRAGIGPAYPVHPSTQLIPAGAPGAPVPYRRAPRWPVWVAALIVALLIAAGVVTLLKVGRNSGGTGGHPGPAQSGQGGSAGPGQAQPTGPPATAPGGSPADTVAPTADSDRDGYVLVRASDYIGQDKDIVVRQLAALGLRPQVTDAAAGSAGPPGAVTALDPTGRIRRHSLITVFAVRGDRIRNR